MMNWDVWRLESLEAWFPRPQTHLTARQFITHNSSPPIPKLLLSADLSSRQWETLGRLLTVRGFLSARVEDARILSML